MVSAAFEGALIAEVFSRLDGGLGVAFKAFGGFFFGCGLAAVASLASVAVGHPDGFNSLAVRGADEVALGAVDGTGGLDDLWKANKHSHLGRERITEGLAGRSGHLVEGGDAEAVEGLVELAGAVGFLAQAEAMRAVMSSRVIPKKVFSSTSGFVFLSSKLFILLVYLC